MRKTVDKFRDEVRFLISSLKTNEQENKTKINAAIKALDAISVLENCNTKEEIEFKVIINQFFSTGLLTPLKLDESEFTIYFDEYVNKRCSTIHKDDKGVYDTMYWIPIIKHVYIVKDMTEIPVNDFKCGSYPIPCKEVLILTKGGVFTDEYIGRIYINTNKSKTYIPNEPIRIPVSVIIDNSIAYFCIDAREPMLGVLKYSSDIKPLSNPLLKRKYDIRKFKKLK